MTHTMPSVEGLLQIYVLAEVKRKPWEVLLNPGCDFKGYDFQKYLWQPVQHLLKVRFNMVQ